MSVLYRKADLTLPGQLKIKYQNISEDILTSAVAEIIETGYQLRYTTADSSDSPQGWTKPEDFKVNALLADTHTVTNGSPKSYDVDSNLDDPFGEGLNIIQDAKFLYIKNKEAVSSSEYLGINFLTFDLPPQGWIMIGSPKGDGILTEIAGTGVITMSTSDTSVEYDLILMGKSFIL